MQGYRKLLAYGIGLACTVVFVPPEHRADAMTGITLAFMGGNGLEHVGGAIRERVANSRVSSAGGCGCDGAAAPPQ